MASVTGVDELMARFNRMAENLQGQAVVTAVLAGAGVIKNEAQDLCPKKTGNLSQSIHEEVVRSTPTMAEVAVGTDVEYGPDVEFGTEPHTILPKDKKALFWPGAAHPVAKVEHPGTEAQPFMRPAIDNKGGEAVQEMADAFREILLR